MNRALSSLQRSLRRFRWRSSRFFDSSSPRVARQSNAVSLPQRPPCSSITGLLPLSIAGGPEPPSLPVILCILVGLPAALWMYKSLMMIIFQRKIIYMGYAPLGSRTEELATDVRPDQLEGISCKEISVLNSTDGARLSGILVQPAQFGSSDVSPDVVIVYFQGNAGNPLHRLPVFQSLLTSIRTHAPRRPRLSSTATNSPSIPKLIPINAAILAVAPRSYWKSTPRRPTQRGILSDYRHVLEYAFTHFPDTPVVVYAHSLGGAIALCVLAQLSESPIPESRTTARPNGIGVSSDRSRQIQGLILENPMASIPRMVAALYPQRWVPYRYLTPFVWDRWDALGAMKDASAGARVMTTNDATRLTEAPSTLTRLARNMLVLVSEHDEVVPREMGAEIVEAASGIGGDERGMTLSKPTTSTGPRLVVVPGALHENAWKKRQWEREVGTYVWGVMDAARRDKVKRKAEEG
ncbi:Protein ABHD13 [Hypsizygus marmoreus]|uniref:Protein ABHD13 n=1 Tax=Hypsizygus marmoreus TaxID=39966 RepID=A0A369JKF5_HYPMA|nr:Protein ABHD13 [Hypsizygus marmoreus]